jgi:hypothetical protein
LYSCLPGNNSRYLDQDMADVLSGPQKTGPEPPVDDSPVAQLMGMRQDKITRCSKCHTKITSGKPNQTKLCEVLFAAFFFFHATWPLLGV